MKFINRRIFLLIGSIITVLVLLLCMLFICFLRFSPRALASNVENAIGFIPPKKPICATAPADQKANLCDHQDPREQGCAADAITPLGSSIGIIDGSGNLVGRIDRRYSLACNTFWARIFDFRPAGSQLVLKVSSQPPKSVTDIYNGKDNHEWYSDMYVATNNAPEIIGWLGDQTSPLTATLVPVV